MNSSLETSILDNQVNQVIETIQQEVIKSFSFSMNTLYNLIMNQKNN